MSSTSGIHTMAGTAAASGDIQPGADAIEASLVTGTNVYSTDGEHLGSIHDIVIGKRDGQVKYAILSFGGFLGIGEEYHPLPWHVLKYDERQGGYVVGVTIDQLQGAPRYAAGEARWSDPATGRRIDDYYGAAPA